MMIDDEYKCNLLFKTKDLEYVMPYTKHSGIVAGTTKIN